MDNKQILLEIKKLVQEKNYMGLNILVKKFEIDNQDNLKHVIDYQNKTLKRIITTRAMNIEFLLLIEHCNLLEVELFFSEVI